MNVLKIILDICLLRGRTQDLPVSVRLVWIAAAVSVIVNSLGLLGQDIGLGPLLFIVSQVALFGAAVWLVLRLRGFPARWLQTITALFAVDAVFNLLLLPLLPALVEILRQGPQTSPGWEGFAMLALVSWLLLINARVLREATEWPLPLAFLAGLTMLLAVRMVGIFLASLFGLVAPA